MWCDALGAEHPLVTTSKTVKLPPPVRGNTAVQKRARKSPIARDGRSASLEPLSERNDNPGEEGLNKPNTFYPVVEVARVTGLGDGTRGASVCQKLISECQIRPRRPA